MAVVGRTVVVVVGCVGWIVVVFVVFQDGVVRVVFQLSVVRVVFQKSVVVPFDHGVEVVVSPEHVEIGGVKGPETHDSHGAKSLHS